MGSSTALRIIIVASLIGSYAQWAMAFEAGQKANEKVQWIQLAAEYLSPADRVYISCIKEGREEAECEKRGRPFIETEDRQREQRRKKWDKVWHLKREREKQEQVLERQAEERQRERQRELEREARERELEQQRQRKELQLREADLIFKAGQEQQRQRQFQIEQQQRQRQLQIEQQQRQRQLQIEQQRLQLDSERLRVEQRQLNELRRSKMFRNLSPPPQPPPQQRQYNCVSIDLGGGLSTLNCN